MSYKRLRRGYRWYVLRKEGWGPSTLIPGIYTNRQAADDAFFKALDPTAGQSPNYSYELRTITYELQEQVYLVPVEV
jgi:hypothetical protein